MLAWLARRLRRLADIPIWLNWLLAVVEPLIVLAMTGVICWAAYWLVFGLAQPDRQTRLLDAIRLLNDNWKAGLLLLLLLFYRTIRTFLEQAEEAWGVKRRRLRGEAETLDTKRETE